MIFVSFIKLYAVVLNRTRQASCDRFVARRVGDVRPRGHRTDQITGDLLAALLFIDFLLSPDGQKIFEEKFRFATSTKDYGFKRWYPEKGMTIDQYEKTEEHWKKLLRDLSRR